MIGRGSRWAVFVVACLAAAAVEAGSALPLPFEGTVTANRLNVRAGPGTQFQAVGDLRKGERVTAVERKGDWLRIHLPSGMKLWVAAQYVDWKEGASHGTVTADNVNLRAAGSINAETVGRLSKGNRVAVSRGKGDWLEVTVEPRAASVWVAARYVEGTGPADHDSREWLDIRRAYEDESVKDPLKRELDGIVARAEKLAAAAQNPKVKERAELFVKEVREEAEWCRKLTATEREREEAIARIRSKYQEELRALLAATPSGHAYLLTGWLYECGNVLGGSPGTHKLVKGGKLIAYVRGNNVDLNRYYGKYVGVNGEESFHPRYPEPVILLHSEKQIHPIGDE